MHPAADYLSVRPVRLLTLLVFGAFALVAGAIASAARIDWQERGPERAVAELPGVGPGWLDTLRRVAGPVTIDTISPLEFYDVPSDLLGLFERWHVLISVNANVAAYTRFVRHSSAMMCEGDVEGAYRHPLAMVTPAGVVAHEFGHRFQFGQRPHVVPQVGDSLPKWARDEWDERFADRFARAMLALRRWDDPDSSDQVLTHRVRYLLLRSYWPKDDQ